jgi:hypothetical protein
MSCSGPSRCVAVGDYGKASGNTFLMTSFTESWNGMTWSAQAAASAGGHSALYAVSCPSLTSCVAAGGTGAYTTYNDGHAMAQSWNGGGWSLATLPTASGGVGSVLFGATCVSPAYCVAVGEVGPVKNAGHALSAVWNGATWRLVTTA